MLWKWLSTFTCILKKMYNLLNKLKAWEVRKDLKETHRKGRPYHAVVYTWCMNSSFSFNIITIDVQRKPQDNDLYKKPRWTCGGNRVFFLPIFQEWTHFILILWLKYCIERLDISIVNYIVDMIGNIRIQSISWALSKKMTFDTKRNVTWHKTFYRYFKTHERTWL